jgi:general secretion pathway protein I
MVMPAPCSSAERRGVGMCRPGGRGFTLLEVLVALTIIAVALTAALRGAMALTSNSREVDLKLYAILVAENQLLELRFGRKQVSVGESQFDCEQGGVLFLCTQSVTGTPNPFFRRVEVHVASRGDGAREYADLMGLLPVN